MKMKISVSIVLVFLLVGVMAVQPVAAQQASKVSEEEAHAIGVHAYVYFYSLITMDVTRKQLTNVEPGKEVHRWPDEYVQQYPGISDRGHEGGRAAQLSILSIRLRGSISRGSR